MSRTGMKKLRSGARVPQDSASPSYLGQEIEESVIVARQEPKVGRTQGRILLAAIALFAERGYENCGIRTIASAVGLKAPTIYNYYPSKEALLVEAIEYGMEDFFSYVLHDLEQVPRENQLFEIARANDKLIDPQFSKMFLPKESQAHFMKRLDDYRHMIHDLVRERVAADDVVDPTLATLAVMNQWDRSAYWYNPAGKIPLDDVISQIMVLTKRMLHVDEERA